MSTASARGNVVRHGRHHAARVDDELVYWTWR